MFLFGRWLTRLFVRVIVIALVFIAGFWLRGSGVGQESAPGDHWIWQIIPEPAKEKMYEAIRDGVREALVSLVKTYPLDAPSDFEQMLLDDQGEALNDQREALIDRLPVDRNDPQAVPEPRRESSHDDAFKQDIASPQSLVTLLEKVSQTMTTKEKETFLSWAESHLTADDLNALNDLLAQGMTKETLGKVYQTMQGKWTNEDFAYVFSLLTRYKAAQALLEGGHSDQTTTPVFGSEPQEASKKEQ